MIFIGDAGFCIAVGFVAGTLAAGLGWRFLDTALLAAVSASVFACYPGRRREARLVFAAVSLAALFAGMLYYSFFASRRAAAMDFPSGRSVSFTAIISGEPKMSADWLLLPADLEKPYAGEVTIFLAPGGGFRYGEEVAVSGDIEPPEAAGDDPAVFPKTISVIAEGKGFWLSEGLLDLKAAILEKFSEALPGDMAALLGGETLGGTGGMSAAFKSQMSASGTSYIVSMYGYKISVLVFVLDGMLGGFVGRRARLPAIAAVVVLFVLMSGGNVSAVRAAVMAILALAAKMIGRVFDPRNALALTAAGMALGDPALPAQAAFELSFLSIAGIFYLAGPLEKFFRWDGRGPGMLAWRTGTVLAIASLLPIVPVIVAAFGDFSLMAFPSNILIFPAVTPSMFCGALVAGLGFAAPPLAMFAARLASPLLYYQAAVIRIFAGLAVPLPFPFGSFFAVAVYYGSLGIFAYYYHEKA
ncbi:MAG TPA: ComEC/Rec2 family competence protein [Candidatus Paceibacterota bacterium]|nr:ComEC/Rec2 family competence protein [Candidatus Paceibacterota bacterium]